MLLEACGLGSGVGMAGWGEVGVRVGVRRSLLGHGGCLDHTGDLMSADYSLVWAQGPRAAARYVALSPLTDGPLAWAQVSWRVVRQVGSLAEVPKSMLPDFPSPVTVMVPRMSRGSQNPKKPFG